MGDLVYIGVLAAAYFALKAMPEEWLTRMVMTVMGKSGLERVGRKALASQPDRLTLERRAGAPGREEARTAIKALERRGFEPGGSFTIREMPGVAVHFLAKASECAVAVVYEHARAGVWCDVATRYRDGSSFTVTSAKAGASMDGRPSHATVRAPGQPAAMLHVRMLNERPAGAMQEIAASAVAPHFTEAYAESIAWRKNRGITATEVRGAALERVG